MAPETKNAGAKPAFLSLDILVGGTRFELVTPAV